MNRIMCEFPFSMRLTYESGQPIAFHAEFKGGMEDTLEYVTEKGLIKVTHNTKTNEIKYSYLGDYGKASARSEVMKRLGLSHNMDCIYNKIDTDEFMHKSISELKGLRMTMNPVWETTLSYVVSQFNNIKRIRLIMRRLIGKYGEEVECRGRRLRLFPTAEALEGSSIKELMECNVGFRAAYIKEVASEWQSFNYERLYKMDYAEAKEELMSMRGIGDKVADCILLMGYGKMEAFPIDTWIKRALEGIYLKKRASNKELHSFIEGKWPEYAGYAQQYIYWYSRQNKILK